MQNQTCHSDRATVIGVFESQAHAQDAVRELKSLGFTDSQIGVAGPHRSDSDLSSANPMDPHDKTESDDMAAVGAATGAGVGALWALGIAAGVLPAIGPAIAGGVLANVLASAVGGAAVAGLGGALIGLGVPEEEANYYQDEVKSGRTLVTVKAAERCKEAFAVLQRHGAYDMQTKDSYQSSDAYRSKIATSPLTASHSTSAAAPARTAQAGESVRLHEEKLNVQKHAQETGEVKLRKEVVTEHKQIEVPVTREEVVIERRPASGAATSQSLNPGEEIRIPVKEEHVEVNKNVVAKEDVTVGKRKITETERVAADVKREEIRVEKEGNPKINRS